MNTLMKIKRFFFPYRFNAERTREDLVEWIRDWFDRNGKDCNAVIGLSGGKDSTIAAALCVEALGAERVIGVGMPDGKQGLNDAENIAKELGIRFIVAPITEITNAIKRMAEMGKVDDIFPWWFDSTVQAEQNLPPRARMIALYFISQCNNGRVVGTCNYSEDYLGYFTIHGDGASDFEPFANLTVTELLQIGDVIGLKKEWVHKAPDDGLPHSSSDEEKFGFTYATLDKYIRGIEEPEKEIKNKIDRWHKSILFKLKPKEHFSFNP